MKKRESHMMNKINYCSGSVTTFFKGVEKKTKTKPIGAITSTQFPFSGEYRCNFDTGKNWLKSYLTKWGRKI